MAFKLKIAATPTRHLEFAHRIRGWVLDCKERTLINLAQVNFYPHTYLTESSPGPRVKANITCSDLLLEHVLVNCHLVPVSLENLWDDKIISNYTSPTRGLGTHQEFIIPEAYICGNRVANISLDCFFERCMSTSTTRPSARKCKKNNCDQIQLIKIYLTMNNGTVMHQKL